MGKPVLRVGRVEALGPALKDLRRSQDVKAMDVCEAADLHLTQLCSWEGNRVVPGLRRLIDVLAAYDYEIVFVPKGQKWTLIRETR